uniref:Kazal type serine protease inhibitor 4 n=1 Tax=Rattus norvegicus TaxID=10116 RepID=Q6IE48_RAT|nr:TPA: Kazal type serine protease inhibitor 4 precursor [Rattus norvegicus]|eukprot:NP_001008871.1 serine protease inhibitor Kazal-type 4 precursor [Rattus norvegicus]
MAMHLWLVTLTLVPLLAMDRFPQPICEHMAEFPNCPRSPNLICGTDGLTYENECHLCVTRMKTKKDIQIMKDGKC